MIPHIKYSVGIILDDLAPLPLGGGGGGKLGLSCILMLFIKFLPDFDVDSFIVFLLRSQTR